MASLPIPQARTVWQAVVCRPLSPRRLGGLLGLVLVSLFVPAVAGAATVSASNGVYRIFMSSNGQYTVQTDAGHPLGAGHNLLFGSGSPGTSFSTVRSYDSRTDYVQGGAGRTTSAGFSVVSLDAYASVSQVGTRTLRATYALPGPGAGGATPATPDRLLIQEDLVVYGSTPSDSGVELQTAVINQGSAAGHFGVRNFFDYQLGADDGPTYQQLSPDGPVQHTESQSAANFQFYRMTDNPANDGGTGPGTLSVLGSVTGPDAPAGEIPDLIQYQSWQAAHQTAFAYTVNPAANVADSAGSDDSAVSILWGDTQADSHVIAPSGNLTFSSTFVATSPGGTFPPAATPPGPSVAPNNPSAPTSPTPGARVPSATRVSCNLDIQTVRDTCTAEVADAGPSRTATPPTGTVNFSIIAGTRTRGSFISGSSCRLTPTPRSPNVSFCAVQFAPANSEFPNIRASYGGDSTRNRSSGDTALIGRPPGNRLPPDYMGDPTPDNPDFTPTPNSSGPCPPGYVQVGIICIFNGVFNFKAQPRAATTATTAAARRPTRGGTTVRYTVRGPAAVRFTVVQLLPGRRNSRGRCVTATRRNHTARRCTRQTPVPGSFTLESPRGANRFLFTGWIANRKLRPGRYLLTGRPTLQRIPGTPRNTPFHITGPRRTTHPRRRPNNDPDDRRPNNDRDDA